MSTVSLKKGDDQKSPSVLLLILKMRTFIALIVVTLFFVFMAPNFLSVANAAIVSKHVAINAILALGMTFVIITAGIDLSVGSIVGLVGMVAGGLIANGLPVPYLDIIIFPNVIEVIVIALIVGAGIGLINGLLITKLFVAPFIATLGTLYVARGAALLLSSGATFPNLVGKESLGNQGYPIIGAGNLFGIPLPIVFLIVLALLAAYVAKNTPFGRNVYAVGGNERASLLSGLRVDRIKIYVYMISGVSAAVVGLIVSSQLVASHPATGESFELNAIAAVVLGGTSLSGGRGYILGTIIGAFVIGVLSDGLVMMGVSEFWQMVIKGLVIIAAVVLDQLQGRLSSSSK